MKKTCVEAQRTKQQFFKKLKNKRKKKNKKKKIPL